MTRTAAGLLELYSVPNTAKPFAWTDSLNSHSNPASELLSKKTGSETPSDLPKVTQLPRIELGLEAETWESGAVGFRFQL